MKRRVLCVFSLIFWLIILCTILSARVEQLMMPTVEVEELNMPLPETSISADACSMASWACILQDGAGLRLGYRHARLRV